MQNPTDKVSHPDLPWIAGIDNDDPTAVLKATLFATLHSLGVVRIIAAFDGSGDSGAIDDPTFWNAANEPVEVDAVMFAAPLKAHEEMGRLRTVADATTHLFDTLLESTGIDWYNNDGGYGTFEANILTGELELEVYERIMRSELHSFSY